MNPDMFFETFAALLTAWHDFYASRIILVNTKHAGRKIIPGHTAGQ
jgi:hypothetical protein